MTRSDQGTGSLPGRPAIAWHTLPADRVLDAVAATRKGLSASQAAARLASIGPNTLVQTRGPGFLGVLLAQFRSLLVYILAAAALVSGLLGEWIDCLAILAIVVINAAIGAFQEHSAERSIGALRRLSAPRARVRRDSAVVEVPAADIVPGDLLVLESGDLVAADARVIEAASLSCVEKALTGESEPVRKHHDAIPVPSLPLADRANMVFLGTAVATGTGLAVAVGTGMRSEVGSIASLLESAGRDAETPLQSRLRRVGSALVYVSLAIVAAISLLGLARGEPPLEILLTSVSLAVAAVPEGLPAIVTVALALGVRRMARRRALIRRLPAVETLGCTSVICTDKTGTLTVGQMTARRLWVPPGTPDGSWFEVTGEGYDPRGTVRPLGAPDDPAGSALRALAENLAGCNNAALVGCDGTWDASGDPTEAAMLVAAAKAGVARDRLDAEHPRLSEFPFDSDRKRSSVLRRWGAGARLLVNGSPECVLSRCSGVLGADEASRPLTDSDRAGVLARNAELAASGLRVLACARRDADAPDALPPTAAADTAEADLVLVGLIGMYDPPRPEARDAVARCREAGIRVVMITGDQPRTAAAIASSLGIGTHPDAVLSGADLALLDDAALERRVPSTEVYARVTAADKLRIVDAWKRSGAVVAMTGDGVNDAPALRGADVGVAMGRSGTEVARQASDMIVTDDNFASIVAAVEEGRGVYQNIRKTMQFLLGGNAAELLFIGICLLAGLPAPLLPIQILWINLVTDGLPALFLAADPVDPALMRSPPRAREGRMLDRPFLFNLVLTATLTAGVTLAAYLWGLWRLDEQTARTYAFATLVFAELLRSFGCRSETLPVWRIDPRSNLLLAGVVAASIAIQIWSHHNEALARLFRTSTLGWAQCASLAALATVPLAGNELAKLIKNRSRKSEVSRG